MDLVLSTLPPEFLQVRFSERMIPGRQPELGLCAGSNCQRYAYAVLRHFGLSVPDHRSSELWADEELLTTVSDPEPLDSCSSPPVRIHGVLTSACTSAEGRSSIYARRSVSLSSGTSRTSLNVNAMAR